ncbi:MAG: glycerophosphodiester phosphodiesterase [Lachnospiraceae bacterium]|nr:glycerophosphodiester phosphodiesterase [Lachnospiraceae bacterium]
MKKQIKEIYQMIRGNLRSLLLFEFFFRFIAGTLLVQVGTRGLKFCLDRAGYSYLTLTNAWKLFLHPWTMLFVLVMTVLALFLNMIEIGGLVTAFSGAAYFCHPTLWEIFSGAFEKVRDELRHKNYRLFGMGMISTFTVNLFYLYRIFSRIKPVNFVIKELLDQPLAVSVLLLVFLLFLALLFPAFFVFHGCMIGQKSYWDSRFESMELLKGRWAQVIGMAALLEMCLIILFLTVYYLSVFLMAVVTVLFVKEDLGLAFLMETTDRAEWFLVILASIFASMVCWAFVTREYYQVISQRKGRMEGWEFATAGRNVRFSKKTGLTLLGLFLAMSGFFLFDAAYNGNFISKSVAVQTRITAHRGSSSGAPENTMAALEKAVEEMADRAEIDVQETADGVIVLCHDTSLKRVAGVNKTVSDLTLEQIKKLDVGSWFSSEYQGEQIPTLEEVMEYAKGKIDLNIEIKNLGNSSGLPEKVIELVEKHEMQEQCVITSTNRFYLKRVKAVNPEIRTGYIISAAYGNFYSDEFIDLISIRSSFVTERMIESAHEAGKAVHAWTVNGKVEMERLKQLGVDDMITDRPVLAREILYGEEAKANLLEYLRLALTVQ